MGNLFIVATPIGNLQDITLRALKTLEEVDFIACEDTRTTLNIIRKFFPEKFSELQSKLFSYYEKMESEKIPQVINMLLNGKNVALLSDAGTPLISDPGFKLIRECNKNNIKVVSVPGASSVISSLVVSGLPTDKFTFVGFLPQKPGHRLSFIQKIKESQNVLSSTVIFFESPHKLINTLSDLKEVLGDIQVVVVREQTKIHEEVVIGLISEIIKKYQKNLKGEITVLFNLKST